MKRHNWNSMPQGQRYESFTGMQAVRQLGPWVEVSQLALVQEVQVSPAEQTQQVQVDEQQVADGYTPGPNLYL